MTKEPEKHHALRHAAGRVLAMQTSDGGSALDLAFAEELDRLMRDVPDQEISDGGFRSNPHYATSVQLLQLAIREDSKRAGVPVETYEGWLDSADELETSGLRGLDQAVERMVDLRAAGARPFEAAGVAMFLPWPWAEPVVSVAGCTGAHWERVRPRSVATGLKLLEERILLCVVCAHSHAWAPIEMLRGMVWMMRLDDAVSAFDRAARYPWGAPIVSAVARALHVSNIARVMHSKDGGMRECPIVERMARGLDCSEECDLCRTTGRAWPLPTGAK